MIDIVTPTLWRSHMLQDYIDNVHENTEVEHRIIFAHENESTDPDVVEFLVHHPDETVVAVLNTHAANPAGAYNSGVAAVEAPYWFASGDDVKFHKGWDTTALALMDEQTWVVGTNDLWNDLVLRGLTATHFLVDSRYVREIGATWDLGPGIAGCEEYGHAYFDTEFIEVAQKRGLFKPCLDAVVEHVHWAAGKSEIDRTYESSFEKGGYDVEIWERRRKLWQDA